VKNFLERASAENRKHVTHLSKDAWDHVMNYSWPGNIRELENAIERAVIMCPGDTVLREHYPIDLAANIQPFDLDTDDDGEAAAARNGESQLLRAVDDLERRMISKALKETGGNKRKAARLLGITERILGYKARKLGI